MLKKSLLVIAFLSYANATTYQDWLNEQSNQYEVYKKTLDEEFSDMLKKDWQAFKSMSTPSAYKKPKPKTLPKAQVVKKVKKEELKESPIVKIKTIAKEKIPKVIEVEKKKEKIYKNFMLATFEFYGENIALQYDRKTHFKYKKINKMSISNYWEKISKSNFKKLLTQIDNESEKLNLNDWAKYQLIYKLGLTIHNDKNLANLFTWFILVKMNYDTKVGYNKTGDVYLLSTIQHSLYQIAFFTMKSKRYYVLTPNGRVENVGSIYTYAGEYPKANQKLSFVIQKDIKLYKNLNTRKLTFQYDGKTNEIITRYSMSLVDFYKTFPQSDYNIYFSTKNSLALSNSILSQLKPLLEGKTQIEAVNILLRFVQTSFKYKTDKHQFDYEKVMFPEETLFYPYSDCEDRSIIFSYLVKNLLGLDVVGVKYHDHLATAVNFSSEVSGSGFVFKNKRYTVSDPTYVNANAGMVMPQYKNAKFEIIDFR